MTYRHTMAAKGFPALPSRQPERQAGFSLVEILVAVALLAMLGLILSTATASIMGAIRDTRLMQDHYHTARVALGRIQNELSMAYLSKHQSEARTSKTVFIGKSNSLTFTYMGHRRMTRDARESDEGVVEYKLERDAKTGGNVLVRREKVIVDDAPHKGGQRQVMAYGVKKLKFQYWNMDKESWQSEWKVEIDRVKEEQGQKAAAAAAVTSVTGNAELGRELTKKTEKTHGPDDKWLPGRVKVTLTLETEDGELEFETQGRVRLMEPLDFNGVYIPKAYENSLNPLGAMSGQTPSGFKTPSQIEKERLESQGKPKP